MVCSDVVTESRTSRVSVSSRLVSSGGLGEWVGGWVSQNLVLSGLEQFTIF